MAYENVEDFLGRNNDPKAKVLLNEWNTYFEKLVCVGGEIFNDILKKDLGKADSLPLIMLHRNAVELIDSISVLINNCCSDPARILLRTLLETYFYCQYITEEDSKRRALSFLICHHHQKLDFNYKLNPNTPQGKQFKVELGDDENLKYYQFAEQILLKKSIDDLENVIKEDLYIEVEKEYQRLKKNLNYRKPVWYEFFNGPSKIEKLAKHLKQVGLYHILYRNLSKSTHGSNIIDGYISPGSNENEIAVSQIRFPYSAQMVTQFTFSLAFRIYRNVIRYHLPEKEQAFNTFYINEIRSFYLHISSNKVLIIN
ncbi:MAG: DUF5677 domain-containing protein [Ignavibacteria bacterium]|nr:DUF5677 domain-containing protein [Ignavibacteria bacterium]MDP3832290.1 DUF5677 domain-containing protein [Ignavibacteriaceae bacterium]